ncbi:hypothetical protein MKW94_007328 [Papaver nudicaule]|uniref:Defensin n=1 Tax=Papaver nudicaule TaxID=74823 RepID=A0AA42B4I1_PAPNU|nr:hypothetical protein [Papaver nudicaule]
MASEKATAIAFLVISVIVANAAFNRCTDNHIGSCRVGNAEDNARCHNMCSSNCLKDGSRGFCKLEGNLHYCHCRC